MVGLDFSAPPSDGAAADELALPPGALDQAPLFTPDLTTQWRCAGAPSAGSRTLRGGQISSRRCCVGVLYLAEGHPTAYVFDDATRSPDGMPGLFAPYFSRGPVVDTEGQDYVDPDARLVNATIYNWIHPLGDVVTSLITSGMTLDWLHEHDAVPWRMFGILVKDPSGLYRWPDRPWLPLAFSLAATRR